MGVRNQQINLGMMSYQSASLPWDAQRLVNLYPEIGAQGSESRTNVTLLPRPGTVKISTVSGVCRGNYATDDALYSVFGGTLYKTDSAYTSTAIGSVNSTGAVYFADNGTQLCVVTEPDAWIYTFSSGTFAAITDIDFLGSSGVTEISGYFVHARPGDSGEFYLSDTLNGLSYDALAFATAEMNTDKLLRPFSDHNELWLFGTRTIEIWSPSGSTDFPFVRASNAGPERGLLAPDSVIKADNTVCWVGSDGIVYQSSGYTPEPISTRPIELKISQSSAPTGITGRYSSQNGHQFYILTSIIDGWTLVYDVTTKVWHERATYGYNWWQYLHPVSFNGKQIVGGYNGNLYTLESATYSEDGGVIRYEATSPPVHANGARLSCSRLEVLMETGVGIATGQGSNPQAMLQWSDDGGRTWSNEHWKTIGSVGAYNTRVTWRNLGQFFSRVYKIAVTDPVKAVILGGYADVDITAT